MCNLCFTLGSAFNLIDSSCNDPVKQSTHCNWSKATQIHTRNYAANLDQVLQSIDISNDVFTCNDLCCTNATHVNDFLGIIIDDQLKWLDFI